MFFISDKKISKVRSFRWLDTFYVHFMKDLISNMNPITEYLRKGEFKWTKSTKEVFNLTKRKIIKAPVFCHPDFLIFLKLLVIPQGLGHKES